jgi:hypothetical protein
VGADDTAGPDPTLVRLHASLKVLDDAIHDTLRTLDIALGRSPTPPPEAVLAFRELGRLKLHLEAATAAPSEQQERNLADMALDWSEDEVVPDASSAAD